MHVYGADYRFLDNQVLEPGVYTFILEDIDLFGRVTRHDPIEVEIPEPSSRITRLELVEDMSEYIDRLRRHMAWEEDDLFERVDAMLDAEPLEFDVSDYEHIKDPVFELEIEAGFKRLMSSLSASRG